MIKMKFITKLFKKIFNKESNQNTKFNEQLLDCPRCKVKMDKIKKEDIIIDVCRKCNGVWLDDKEIDKLVDIAKRLNIHQTIYPENNNNKTIKKNHIKR